MKKLLHERLRGIQNKEYEAIKVDGYDLCLYPHEAETLANAIERYYVPREEYDELMSKKTEYAHHAIKAWAEERGCPMKKNETITQWLNRYYIPRPRFVDGKPVQLGDDVVYKNIQLGCPVDSFTFRDGGICEVFGDGNSISINTEIEYFKHPSPKVLDADGVEIKVWDMVYDLMGLYHKPFVVLEVREKDIKVSAPVGIGYTTFTPDELTHREPVLDANGVPIKVEDTVWSKGGAEYIVEEIKDEDHIHLRRPYEDKALVKMTARCLTHKEPDSLEKLLEYLEGKYNLCSYEMDEVRDRLSALIEKKNQ